MQITIRNIQEKDDEALAQIVRENLAAHGLALPGTAYFDPELEHLSCFYGASQQREYFVAVDEQDRVLGGAGIAGFIGDESVAELQKLYLSDEAKGNGIGYQLIGKAEEFAAQAGYGMLYLETHHKLEAANHVYEKAGFTRMAGPLPGSSHGTMDVFWKKELPQR